MSAVKLSIVIVNYNVRYYVEQCLRSVQYALVGIPSEIWVVDNASSDDSVNYLQDRFPEVHFIANRDNHGFSYANNQAIRQSKGEFVLLLNPDTLVAEDTFRICLSFLDNHPQVGAVGVRMLRPDGSFAPESRRGLPTPFTSFCKITGLSDLFPKSRIFGKYYMRYCDHKTAHPIEVISGAYNMIRKTVLDEIGLLDEDFFMYGEDIDLSYRILKAGWQNYYLPCMILHYKGESTEKSSYRYVYIFYQAMLIFYNKHFSKRYFFFNFFIRLAVYFQIVIALLKRFVDKMRGSSHAPAPMSSAKYLSFDFDTTTVKEMLERLKNQPATERHIIETYSHKTGMTIRPHEVLPLTEK